jgi:hypothetical protein
MYHPVSTTFLPTEIPKAVASLSWVSMPSRRNASSILMKERFHLLSLTFVDFSRHFLGLCFATDFGPHVSFPRLHDNR